jgi:hypothetical protein
VVKAGGGGASGPAARLTGLGGCVRLGVDGPLTIYTRAFVAPEVASGYRRARREGGAGREEAWARACAEALGPGYDARALAATLAEGAVGAALFRSFDQQFT